MQLSIRKQVHYVGIATHTKFSTETQTLNTAKFVPFTVITPFYFLNFS